MKAATAPLLLPILVVLEACSAFIPSLIATGATRACRGRRISSISELRSTPADAIDAVPSDVTPEPAASGSSDGNGKADGGSSDYSLASELVATIQAGVGEGYIPYSEADKSAIEDLVVELESAGEDTDIMFPRDLSKLDGRWKLLFTNNVLGLGKLSPVTLKEVYQVVDSSERTVSNVVYAVLSPPMFSETWGKLGQRVADLARTVEDRITFDVDFNINHSFDVSSQSMPAQIELVQKEVKLMNVEDAAKQSLALPALAPLAKAAAGRFDSTFLSQDVRVSRGRFGELRVFAREGQKV